MTARNSRYVLLAPLLMFALTGCLSSDDIGASVPVTGKVTIDGRPLESGQVSFMPDQKKGNQTKAAVSGMVKDGEYTLRSETATSNKPGAPAGWYKVTISPGGMMPAPGPTEPKIKDGKPTVAGPKAAAIAEKYRSALTTPLEVEVKQGNGPDAYKLEAFSKK